MLMSFPNGLRLFVVGERSGNPGDWPIECRRAYVVAHDAEEARALARMGNEPVAAVPPDEPMYCVEVVKSERFRSRIGFDQVSKSPVEDTEPQPLRIAC
jgi:hypothetical protein